jgi:hypothetical protein
MSRPNRSPGSYSLGHTAGAADSSGVAIHVQPQALHPQMGQRPTVNNIDLDALEHDPNAFAAAFAAGTGEQQQQHHHQQQLQHQPEQQALSPSRHAPFKGHWYWQKWPGRNKPFACFGHVVLLARDHDTLAMSVFLIVAAGAVFLAGVAWHMHVAIFAIGIAVCVLPLVMLALTTFTEAGILPRKSLAEYPHHVGSPVPGNNGPLYPAPTQMMDGNEIPLKWCTTCHIYRPLRASHCRDCDCCVEEFDHRPFQLFSLPLPCRATAVALTSASSFPFSSTFFACFLVHCAVRLVFRLSVGV